MTIGKTSLFSLNEWTSFIRLSLINLRYASDAQAEMESQAHDVRKAIEAFTPIALSVRCAG